MIFNDKLHFIDPDVLAHTQNIESFKRISNIKFKKQIGVYDYLLKSI